MLSCHCCLRCRFFITLISLPCFRVARRRLRYATPFDDTTLMPPYRFSPDYADTLMLITPVAD